MPDDTLTVALIRDVFAGEDDGERLKQRLREAAALGSELAVLPELPLNPWSATSKTARDEDAERPPPDGARFGRLVEAVTETGVAVLGGAIVQDQESGRRLNTALLIDASGRLVGTYSKIHLPQEPGYWETSHYEAGTAAPVPLIVPGTSLPVGIQICSDINRPAGAQLLAARGAEAIIIPRATEAESYPRWRLVFQTVALTNGVWVVSVNRPDDPSVPIGGPSVVVDPLGQIVLETEDPVVATTLDRRAVASARRSYPGYLSLREPWMPSCTAIERS